MNPYIHTTFQTEGKPSTKDNFDLRKQQKHWGTFTEVIIPYSAYLGQRESSD